MIFQEEFFLIGIGKDPTSVLVTLFVFGKVEVLLLPYLLDLVQLFFILELLDRFIDDLKHFLLVSFKLQSKHLVQGHGLY